MGRAAVRERMAWDLALDAGGSVWKFPSWKLCFPSCMTRSVRSARQLLGDIADHQVVAVGGQLAINKVQRSLWK